MFHSPETLLKNSTRLFAGVCTIHFNTVIMIRRSIGTNRHKIFIFVIYFQNKSANIQNFSLVTSKKHKYGRYQICTIIQSSINGGEVGLILTKRSYFIHFFHFFRSFIHFFLTVLRLFYLFFSLLFFFIFLYGLF